MAQDDRCEFLVPALARRERRVRAPSHNQHLGPTPERAGNPPFSRLRFPLQISSSPMLRASQFAHTDKVEYLLTSSNSEAKHLSELRGLRFTIAFRNARFFLRSAII